MGPVLLQEETGLSGENLRCLVESNWTTIFSHVTTVTFNQITTRSRNRTQVTVVRDTCTSTVPPALLVCANTMNYMSIWRWISPFNKHPLKLNSVIRGTFKGWWLQWLSRQLPTFEISVLFNTDYLIRFYMCVI